MDRDTTESGTEGPMIPAHPTTNLQRLVAGRILAQQDIRHGGRPRDRSTSHGMARAMGDHPSEHARVLQEIRRLEAGFIARTLPAEDHRAIQEQIFVLEDDLREIYFGTAPAKTGTASVP